MTRILVVGANGTVGTSLTRALTQKGHDVVRATHQKELEPDQVHLNLATREGIDDALEGVRRAFLLAPPGFTNHDELLAPMIDAARERSLEKVVLMSAMGANADPNAALRKAELHLEGAGVPWNVIRPNWFMQNFNTFWLHGINTQNKILLPTGKAKGSFIDARDIASTAAKLLDSDNFANREFDLTGPRALDHDEVATILSKEAGRDIRYQEVSPEAFLPGLIEAGLPRNYAEFLVVLLGYFKAGYSERTTDSVQEITGKAPTPFEQYAKDHRSSWVV